MLHFASLPEIIYTDHIKLDSAKFWEIYLGKTQPEFQIQDKLRTLLQHSISLAIGTSSVERVFSVLGNIQTKPRNRLTVRHMKSLLFIRTNMQMDIEDFPAEDMAEQYYIDGHLRADDPIVPVKKPRKSAQQKDKSSNNRRSKLFKKDPKSQGGPHD